jgi:hypothetical protein
MPELCFTSPPLKEKRAQGKPGARCTRGLACQMRKQKRTRAYRFSGEHPAFPAQWFYGLLRALPGERLFCHRRPVKLASQELDASTAASGPHDFAVRVTRFRLVRIPRPPHLTATFVTIASRPSFGCDARSNAADLPDRLSGIFLRGGMDRLLVICPSGQLVA